MLDQSEMPCFTTCMTYRGEAKKFKHDSLFVGASRGVPDAALVIVGLIFNIRQTDMSTRLQVWLK